MPRSNADVVRVECLFPPAVADAVRVAAETAGLGLGTWIVSQAARAAKVEYTPPQRGRTPNLNRETKKPRKKKIPE